MACTRREFMKKTAIAALAAQVSGRVLGGETWVAAGANVSDVVGSAPVTLHWLEGRAPAGGAEVTWGVPWPRGQLSRGAGFSLATVAGEAVPVQSWPLAYWPDGSLKWTGHAACAKEAAEHRLSVGGERMSAGGAVAVQETAEAVEIDTGVVRCRVPRKGEALFSELVRGGRVCARNAALVCHTVATPSWREGEARRQVSRGRVERVTVEQNGPVRAVVKIEGRHVETSPSTGAGPKASERIWLPFVVRLYFYAGSESVRAVHTFIYDGEAERDFVAALGVMFAVPLSGDLHNRHVRFTGEGEGLWGEAVRNLPGWSEKFPRAELYARQLAGERCPALTEFTPHEREQIESVAAWDDFRVTQLASSAFTVQKRTQAKSAWIKAGHGERASGLGYVGGEGGGVAFGLRDFWQRHPTELEINGARSDEARVTMWLWSPEAEPMDLRHYDVRGHGLEINYEDYQEGHATPMGIASTHEWRLWAEVATPTRERLVQRAAQVQAPALLVCEPRHYHATKVFGVWSLPDRSTPARTKIEEQIDRTFAFYDAEIERCDWHGFWDHGDVMHTYDRDRHAWRYDVGGFAWDNNELVPALWWWVLFLRSGRADVFRRAEALTRHTSEVDVHHTGPFAHLGSRHNVRHWGDGAKEARISMAGLKRPFYYLTADERTGDLMRAMVDADRQLLQIDPLRKVLPKTNWPTHARSGPDWLGFASNWLAEWERMGDERYRERIVTGLRNLGAMPRGMFSGPAFGYDPDTHTLHHIGDENYMYHMISVFGGAEVAFELAELIDEPSWTRAWLEFCELYNAPPDDAGRRPKDPAKTAYPVWHARLTAWAAKQKGDAALARRAWDELLYAEHRTPEQKYPLQPRAMRGPEALNPGEELPWLETNHASQWSLNAIELLALVPEALPERLGGAWE